MMRNEYILGVNAYHADSSAALLKNGEVIYATEEERFTRVKHWAGFPIQSIKFCLNAEGISMKDVDSICIGRDPNVKKLNKFYYLLKNPRSAFGMFWQRFSNRNDLKSIEDIVSASFGYCPKLNFIEHHRSHLASAFYSSPFNKSAVVSIDGSGDFTTVMIGLGEGSNIKVIDSLDFPVSVGILYSAFTQFLGFPYYGDEYKVMGLSPYGKPKYLDILKDVIKPGKKTLLQWDSNFFNLKEGAIHYEGHIPIVKTLFDHATFKKAFGSPRKKGEELTDVHKNIASSVQVRTEEIIYHILNKAHEYTKCSNICLAGGVAQNSVANGKILNRTPFEKLYIPSAGHDAGIAMGAAQYQYFNNEHKERVQALYNANLGIEFSNEEIEEILKERSMVSVFLEDGELFDYITDELQNNKVLGFFDGRAEFGPRALGSRSIIADPRNSEAQKLLNEKIKKRESFRPFAPSILEEYGDEFFENYQFTPFMERVLPIKEEKRELIPAVTHIDGSGRLQSVRKDLRPRYHALISKFYEKTGIPLVINTSFNENEPVVNHPNEAIDCYLRTDLDILVLGNHLLSKDN